MPKALIIDDEASIATIVGRFLENNGFETEGASSGPEGLQKAVVSRPDVVIVDIMMPEMDGYEVCRRLRSDPRTARALIVALTARGQPIDRQMALRSGADVHMAKPFKGKALAEEVRRLFGDRLCAGPPLGHQILVLRLAEGVGVSTLVSNLACSLAQKRGCQVIVADLDFEGGAAERLGLSSADSWWASPQLAPGALSPFLLKHESGAFVLPAPSPPLDGQVVGDTTQWLLQTLRTWGDFVLPDTPLDLGPLAPTVLRSSALVLLLLTPDPAAIRQAQATLAAIRSASNRAASVWAVFNQVRPEQRALVEEAERSGRLPVSAVMPWAPQECVRAEAEHEPVVVGQPASALATAISGLARSIAQAAGAQSQKRR